MPSLRLLRPPLRALALALALVPGAYAQGIGYPPTRRSDQVDVYHGSTIADPYRWLETTNAPETRAWIDAQNALTESFLAAAPERASIRNRLAQLWDYPKYEIPVKRGSRYFYAENSGVQNQAVLYVQDSRDARARLLLDPNLLSSDASISLAAGWMPSWNGRLLAYPLSDGGSDWREIRVRDVLSSRDLADTLKWVKFSSISWTHDNRGFFYSRFDADTANSLTRAVRGHKLYYHRIGTPQARDELVFHRSDQPDWLVSGRVTDDGQYLVLAISEGTDPRSRLYFIDLDNPRRPLLTNPVVRLLDRMDAEYIFVGNVGQMFIVRTDNDAPRGKIVIIDIAAARPESWMTAVPEATETIQSADLVGERLVVTSLRDAHTVLRLYEPLAPMRSDARRPPPPARGRVSDTEGLSRGLMRSMYRLGREIELPALGTVSAISGLANDAELFYDFVSFLHPRTIFRYDVRRGTGGAFRTPPLTFDPSLYETRQVFYTSADGTRIPMFITARKGLVLDGNNPTLLHGYGGFAIAQTPGFSVRNLVWLEMGGVYALANLRGGSEYGRQWHDAGRLRNKQNVFDDFIAAAEYLIAERYTSAPKLAISGGSNGGLLVGAVLNQRPELFGAALPANGVMDMFRFHRFTIGWAWTSDYGSADDSTQFTVLRAYSPLHNVRPGTRYPATLVLAADYDDRVIPGHSFKYVATLQNAQTGPAPIMVRIETRVGHGAGTATQKQIEESTDRLTFLVRALGIGPTLPR